MSAPHTACGARFRPGRPDDAPALAALVRSHRALLTLDPEGRGAEAFLASVSEAAMRGYLESERFACTVAEVDGALAGFIALRDVTHLFHLFVETRHQRQGLARRLWLQALDGRRRVPEAPFTVNASLNAVDVYRRLGFEAAGPVTEMHGIAFLPMTRPAGPGPLPRRGTQVALRRLSVNDLQDFQAYRHAPGLGRYQGWQPQSDADAAAFLAQMGTATLAQPGGWTQLGIEDRARGKLVGDIGLRVDASGAEAEFGITLAPSAQGGGRATEAAGLAIALAFEASAAARVIAVTDARNFASIRLLERLGMTRLATTAAVFRGEACTEHTYAIARGAAPPA